MRVVTGASQLAEVYETIAERRPAVFYFSLGGRALMSDLLEEAYLSQNPCSSLSSSPRGAVDERHRLNRRVVKCGGLRHE